MWAPQVVMEDSERYKMQRSLSLWVKSETRNPSRAKGSKAGQDQGADSDRGLESIRNILRQIPGVLDQEFLSQDQ